MSYIQMKTLLYMAQTAFGAGLVTLAVYAGNGGDPVQQCTSWAMVLIGSGLITFGVLTFVLKDDPDIWR